MLIEVISSTTREGRFSERVATWVTGQLATTWPGGRRHWAGIDTATGDREQ
jgi:hypothetical protein